MRMMLTARMCNEKFNASVKDGTLSSKIRSILEVANPEAAYFTELSWQRCAVLIIDVQDSAQIPACAEPWFLTFNAQVEFHICMTPEDLSRSRIEQYGKTWG